MESFLKKVGFKHWVNAAFQIQLSLAVIIVRVNNSSICPFKLWLFADPAYKRLRSITQYFTIVISPPSWFAVMTRFLSGMLQKCSDASWKWTFKLSQEWRSWLYVQSPVYIRKHSRTSCVWNYNLQFLLWKRWRQLNNNIYLYLPK